MPDHRKLILLGVLILASLYFIDYFFLSNLLPERIEIPDITTINIRGLYLIACLWVVNYFLIKSILKKDPEMSLTYLTMFGFLIALLSEFIFQSFRQFTFSDITNVERIKIFVWGILGLPLVASGIAFSVAFDFKYKNRLLATIVNISFGALLLGVAYLLNHYSDILNIN